MDTVQHIRTLQVAYAAQLADAVVRFERAGILERVTDERRSERLAAGAAQAARLGVEAPAEAFTVPAELFGCADWTVDEAPAGEGFTAGATRCLLCALVKKSGGPDPCRLCCLDPIEAMVTALAPGAAFEVLETLYGGERCSVTVRAS